MRMRLTVLLSALLSLTVTICAGASDAVPLWHNAQIASLPHGAIGVHQGYLPALSCPSARNCSAGGAYSDKSGNAQGLVLREVAGTWKAPTKLVAPPGALSDPSLTVEALSCGDPANCVAVGNYQDHSRSAQSFIASERDNVWGVSRRVSLPSNATKTGQNSQLRSISCTSAGNCSAVGSYLDNSHPISHLEGFVVSELRGTWTNSLEVREPSNANLNPYVGLSQVTCGAAGDCTAVGSYIDRNNVTHALMLNQQAGVWHIATALALPGDANAFPIAGLSEVSCATATNCTVFGSYITDLGAIDALMATEVLGSWQRATSMHLPANAAANPRVFFYGLGGLSCPSIGNCSAGGQYVDVSNTFEGFLVNEVNGVWKQATELILPRGARGAGKNGGVVAVSCRRAGHCSAGAAYLDRAGRYQALVVNEAANHWGIGRTVKLPGGAASVGVNGGVYGLVCNARGPCTATGTYLDSTATYQGFTVTTN